MAVGTVRLIRQDAEAKARGEALYTADLRLPGLAYAKMVYAPFAPARITSLSVERARRHPGVLAVVTQQDVPLRRYGPMIKDRTLFAHEVVRYEGEFVAGVVARTPEIAQEACDLVEVEYEPIAAVLDPVKAMDADAPLVHPEWRSYAAAWDVRDGNECARTEVLKGDVEAGFADADEILTERYTSDLSHAVPIEPHAVTAQWEGRRVVIWSATQVPFHARKTVADALDLSEADVRVVVPHLGGGFGGKCEAHFEAHVAAMARAAGRPVQLVLSRREEFVVPDMSRHPIIFDLTTGVKRDGTITARRARLVLDTGAYAAHGPAIAELATMLAVGPYRIPNVEVVAHTMYTHRTPAGSVRAPSGPQTCWAVEQHTDALAALVGMTPYEFRMRTLVDDGDAGPTGQRLTGVTARAALEAAASGIAADRPLRPGEGIGFSCGFWSGGLPGPSDAAVKVNADGSASIVTGAQENGSGAVMGLAILVAEELGIAPEAVSIAYQDTAVTTYDAGSEGSQTTFNAGRAVVAAASALREKLLALAASELAVAPEDVELRDGMARAVTGDEISIADLAGVARRAGELLTAQRAPAPPPLPESFGHLSAGRVSFPAFAAPSFSCHAVRLHVDEQTGRVTVDKVVACHDVGRLLNRVGAEGQVEGGVVHSIGMALLEGIQHDADMRQLNTHLTDYKLQTAADAPLIEVTFLERDGVVGGGPYGSKGLGEAPVIPTAGAVANAIAAATGARVRQLPMTPERVWSAMDGSAE